jgi:hypothetical protein
MNAWRADWRKALALFKKKEFDAACPLFESAARAQPRNGAIWGDLGLCEVKRGTGESMAASVHASRLAIRFGDERVRKAAYYNLGLASERESLASDGCTVLSAPPEAECSQTAVACTKRWTTSGIVYQQFGTVAFVALTEGEAKTACDAVSELDPHPDATDAGIILEEGSENSCGSWCAGHFWQTEDSSALVKQAVACSEGRRGPLSGRLDLCIAQGKRCTDIYACIEAVVSHAGESEAVAREYDKLLGQCQRDCTANEATSPPTSCGIVHVDPCRRRVGVVCSTPNPNGRAPKLTASELELPEPTPSEP